jgi:bifunctional non-homologous end joining protein LigD
MQSASLYFKEGGSDKVYHATVEPKGNKFVVNFSYGRRGGNMTTGTKTSSPVDLEEAKKVWKKLVDSKLAKGYRHMTEDSQGVIPQADLPDTPTESQCVLLNPVDEDECERLLGDNKWAAQPKFDGVRFMLGVKGGKVYALNRKGKHVSVPTHIAKCAEKIGEEFLLDGELVGDVLHVFDVLEYGECVRQMPLEERGGLLLRMTDILRIEGGDKSPIKFVGLYTGRQKKRLHDTIKEEGGEGIVFKRMGSKYNVGRPASGGNYLKFKFYSTATCVVGDINEKRSVSLRMGCGTEVGNVTIPPNHEVPKKGDLVEVRYLYAYKGGSLYQPTYLGVRDDVDADLAEELKFTCQ